MSHHKLRTPTHLHGLSPLELCTTTDIGSFTRGGIYPYLLLLDTSSLPFYSAVQLCWTSSQLTEHTHSHLFNAMSPCICDAIRHCMLYHATCIMNATWTTLSTPLTGCHGQSNHRHMTSIHSCLYIYSSTHISTLTHNMSFYVQAMTHTQSSHVMAICTYKSTTCQYIKTHILTSKHVIT